MEEHKGSKKRKQDFEGRLKSMKRRVYEEKKEPIDHQFITDPSSDIIKKNVMYGSTISNPTISNPTISNYTKNPAFPKINKEITIRNVEPSINPPIKPPLPEKLTNFYSNPNISKSELKNIYKKITRIRAPLELGNIPQTAMLRVMTFNIANATNTKKLDRIMNIIFRSDITIACLQEVTLSQDFKKIVIDELVRRGYDYVVEPSETNNVIVQLNLTFYKSTFVTLVYKTFVNKNNNKILKTKFQILQSDDDDNNNDIGESFLLYNVYFTHHKQEQESRVDALKYIVEDADPQLPLIVCGDFNALRKDDYTEHQWTWIVGNRKKKNIADVEDSEFSKIIAKEQFESAMDQHHHTQQELELLYTVWSMRVVDHIFLKGENWNWKIYESHIIYTYIDGDYPMVSDHLPLVADIYYPTQVQKKFNKCIDNAAQNKKHKDVIVSKGSILYHGTIADITHNELHDNSFLSNRLRFPNHWAQKGTRLEYGVPMIYKFSVNKDLKLLLLDENKHYECKDGVCVGEGVNKKKLKCNNSFQCTEQPNYNGLGQLYYKECGEDAITSLIKEKLLRPHHEIIDQDSFLQMLCLYTDYDGFKWTQHEQEFALCKPKEVLTFEGVSKYSKYTKYKNRAKDLELLLQDLDIGEHYSDWQNFK